MEHGNTPGTGGRKSAKWKHKKLNFLRFLIKTLGLGIPMSLFPKTPKWSVLMDLGNLSTAVYWAIDRTKILSSVVSESNAL